MSLPMYADTVQVEAGDRAVLLTFRMAKNPQECMAIALAPSTAKETAILLRKLLKALEQHCGVISNINWAGLQAAPEDW